MAEEVITLQKVKEALRVTEDGKRRLDLSNRSIATFPLCILRLNDVDELDLSCNLLKDIPDDIGKLRNLRVLDLHSNRLEWIPASIGRLKNLQSLNLRKNCLTSYGLPSELVLLSSLRILNLQLNHIETYPTFLDDLKDRGVSLLLNKMGRGEITLQKAKKAVKVTEDGKRRLDLHHMRLTKYPMCILRLNDVDELDLSCNLLKEIPDDIGKLRNLCVLDLHSNRLEWIPASIDLLKNLQSLNLRKNCLTTYGLPSELVLLSSLRILNLQLNHIETYPTLLDDLKDRGVSLLLNKMGRGEITLQKAKKAVKVTEDGKRRLDLHHMRLTKYPMCILRLNDVDELDLSDNLLQKIPKEIDKFVNLRVLNLNLKRIPRAIGRLQNLELLDLCHNRLTTSSLPRELAHMSNLRLLNLDLNPMTILPTFLADHERLRKWGTNSFLLTTTVLPEWIQNQMASRDGIDV